MDIVEFAEKICEENGYELREFEKDILRKLSNMPDRPPIALMKHGHIFYIPYNTEETIVSEADIHTEGPLSSYKIRRTGSPLNTSKCEYCDELKGFKTKLAICDEFYNPEKNKGEEK